MDNFDKPGTLPTPPGNWTEGTLGLNCTRRFLGRDWIEGEKLSLINMRIKINRLGLLSGTATLTGLCLFSQIIATSLAQTEPPTVKVQPEAVPRQAHVVTSFAPVVQKIAPSVVSIYSSKTTRGSQTVPPLFRDPFFRRFFGGGDDEAPSSPHKFREQSLGSGVIVSKDGYILTNNHVVEGADEIKVSLANGTEFTAKVIGADPPTDVAVVKVDAKDLPAVTLADSSKIQVGDIVLAVGNPFDVGQTVTMGIVSATGRSGFGIVGYEDFIQTDASINPGNSGGALSDAEGRLIGINTAILSGSGGNQGIGFATPVNLARFVMDQIIKNGKVVRGYLGIKIQTLTPALAKQFKIPQPKGALVDSIQPNSPAAKAGIEPGDVITEFNGKELKDSKELQLLAAQTPPGTKVNLKLVREAETKQITATLAELPKDAFRALNNGGDEDLNEQQDVLDGVELGDLDPRTRRALGIPANLRGAVVASVDPNSTAAEAGLRTGDVITEVNRKAVHSAREAADALKSSKQGSVLLRVWSKGGSHFLVIDTKKAEKEK